MTAAVFTVVVAVLVRHMRVVRQSALAGALSTMNAPKAVSMAAAQAMMRCFGRDTAAPGIGVRSYVTGWMGE